MWARAFFGVFTCTLAFVVPVIANADPRTDYILNCQGCHAADGRGATAAVPDFRDQLGKFLQVPGGREYLVRVPGTSQSELNDARLAAMLNWMLREFSGAELPAGFMPYTGAEIARTRRPPLTDVAPVRRQLIEALAALKNRPPTPH
ncbi:MAG TPA: hypothetical protein VL403_15055 [Candidatus Kryptonia bacterium]|nr:hypothetical protein [Candidatus Kryptonia bacterium]